MRSEDGITVRQCLQITSATKSDESKLYKKVGTNFAKHETVTHSHGEYARGDVTTNSVEGYFSIFKRGMRGIYQHRTFRHGFSGCLGGNILINDLILAGRIQ